MDELEQIKSRINIVDFINEYVSLKRAGRNFKALCPFHTEKTPSFVVSPERQIWHCFGTCGEGGDIFRFLMKLENLEFPEALQILAKRAGVKLREYAPGDLSRQKERFYEINHLASEFYQYLLLNHPSGKKALDYILGRGISRKTIEIFKIGWAPNLWESVSQFLIKKKGYKLSDLDQVGLLVKGERGYYDRFRGRLIFTLKNHRGEVVGFAGRVLDPQVKEAPLRSAGGGATQGQAKYINTPETPIYTKGNILYGLDITHEAIKKEDRAIIVEGEIDLIQAYQAGSQNVVAIKGSALTEGQVTLLKRYTENISLALDTDLAGDTAARRGAEIADSAGLNVRVIQLEKGKDPDECLRQDPTLWFRAVKGALPFYDFLIESALKRYSPQTGEGKKKISQELLPVISNISNDIVKAHYVKNLSRRLDLSEEIIWLALAKTGKKETPGEATKKHEEKKSRDEIVEGYLLSLILQSPDPGKSFNYFISLIDTDDLSGYFVTPSLKRIFLALAEFLAKNKFQVDGFVRSLPKELVAVVDYYYLKDWGKSWDKEDATEPEIEKIALEIKTLAIKRELKGLSDKMKRLEDDEKVKKLAEQFQKVSRELRSLN